MSVKTMSCSGCHVWPQVGGQQPRWQLYHHLYLIEHSGKRTTPLIKGSTGANPHDKRPHPPPPPRQDHPLNEHVDWMLPTLLRVCACLHAIWTPQVRLLASHTGCIHLAYWPSHHLLLSTAQDCFTAQGRCLVAHSLEHQHCLPGL